MCKATDISVISDDEKLARTAYSPMHFNAKGKIRPSCFQPIIKEPDEDNPKKVNNKVSVTRLTKAGWAFCICHGLKYQKETKIFKGFLVLMVGRVRELGLDVQYKPTDDNPFHANIVYTEIDKDYGEDLDELEDARLQEKKKLLVERGAYFSKEEVEAMLKI